MSTYSTCHIQSSRTRFNQGETGAASRHLYKLKAPPCTPSLRVVMLIQYSRAHFKLEHNRGCF